MSMKIDARYPVFVFVGAWNPAIFEPGWIARHLFGVPEGQQEPAVETLVTQPVPKNILYIQEVGIAVANDRVDFFANGLEESVVKKAEEVALRLVETLPHTPFGAFGVNFHFDVSDPENDLLDVLKTRDNIEQHYKILSQNLTSTVKISDDVVLNFSRRPSAKNVVLDFNYHHRQLHPTTAKELLIGVIQKYLRDSTDILEKLYNLKGYDVIKHVFPRPGTLETKHNAN